MPFGFNPKANARQARMRLLTRKGVLKPLTKAEARDICKEAFEQWNTRKGQP
jgi:hypothetical protein